MKPTALLLAVSLAANLALAGILLLRSPSAPDASSSPRSVVRLSGDSGDALRAALAAGDAAALEAAGVPADLARQIAASRAIARATDKLRALQAKAGSEGRWWRNRTPTAAEREELALAQRELSDALAAAYGMDALSGGREDALAFLPPAKRQALSRIVQDYEEMMAKYSASGIQLPSDREKLKLLRAERDRDIAALLTPAELADYELRTSASAQSLRARFGDAIESEDDFRRLFALQKAFDEKYPRDALTGRITPEVLQERAAAERRLQEEMRAALGEEKYAALRRAADSDLRSVEALASRLGLPADTADRVAEARANYAAESQRINADASLTPQQRRAQIQELAGRARAEMVQALGAEAGDAYTQRSSWLSMLQGGMAYSTNPKDAPDGGLGLNTQSVFPLFPAGATAGIARQVVSIGAAPGSSPGSAPANTGTFFFNAAAPMPAGNDNLQISIVRPEAGGFIAVPPTGAVEAGPGGAVVAPREIRINGKQ